MEVSEMSENELKTYSKRLSEQISVLNAKQGAVKVV